MISLMSTPQPALTKAQRRAIERRVQRLQVATIEHAFRGAGDPADIPYIERDLEKAQKSLSTYLRKLERGA